MRLETRTPGLRVKHFTNEPHRSPSYTQKHTKLHHSVMLYIGKGFYIPQYWSHSKSVLNRFTELQGVT